MIAGLVSRVIFISPSWDKNENITYTSYDVEIGSVSFNNTVYKQPAIYTCYFDTLERRSKCMYVKPPTAPPVGDVSDSRGENVDNDIVSTDNLDGRKVHTFILFSHV